MNNGACGSGIECQNTEGGYLCGDCPSGTTGRAPDCADIDECATDNGGCDELTTCSNNPQSGARAVCGTCPRGYAGTGEIGCSDVDECAADNGGCGSLPDGALLPCENFPGGYRCGDCPAGYTGSAPNCVDIDECETNNGGCDALASCTNAPVSGLPPLCGIPRSVIERLAPARNPSGFPVLVEGKNINTDSVQEIRVGGQVLAASAIQWPEDLRRFPDRVALQMPTLAPGFTQVDIVSVDGSVTSQRFEVLAEFPLGPWPPAKYVFPHTPDLRSIPVVTAVPIADSAPGAPDMLYDFVEESPALEDQCAAEFAGTECIDYIRTGDGNRFPCNVLLNGELVLGTCMPGDDPILPVLPYAIGVCCVDDSCSSRTPCAGNDCSSCAFRQSQFVRCNPFIGSWNISENHMEMTVTRDGVEIHYTGECDAEPADPEAPALARRCQKPVFTDPEGRQLVIGCDFPGQTACR